MDSKDLEIARQGGVLDQKNADFAHYRKEKNSILKNESERYRQDTKRLRDDIQRLDDKVKSQQQDGDKLVKRNQMLQHNTKLEEGNQKLRDDKESLQDEKRKLEEQVTQLQVSVNNQATQSNVLVTANQEFARCIATYGIDTYNYYSQYSLTSVKAKMEMINVPTRDKSAHVPTPSPQVGVRGQSPSAKSDDDMEEGQINEVMEQ